MNRAKFTILAATLGLALAFTISCGEHDWGENHLLGNSGNGGDYSSSSFGYNGSYEGSNPLLRQTLKVGYGISNATDFTGKEYLKYSLPRSSVSTFVNQDGTVTVCVSDEDAKTVHIYEFSMTLELQRQLSFPYEFDMFGAFTKDSDGNYYLFYAKEAADLYQKDADNEPENMLMVKYDRGGNKIKTYTRKPKVGTDKGIQLPFRAGNCRLEISGSMLAVYFARRMFKGEDDVAHQASYGFVLNKDTFEEVPVAKPYASHSFNQFILPINNGFVFADHGDAYPRAFKFSRAYGDNSNIKYLNSFTFAGNTGDNATNAQMGGLAKTSGGYIFAGTYGESPNKRNLLILTFDEAITAISNPRYLTTYAETDNHSIGNPKIVGIGSGQYLLLWELYELSSTGASKYLTTKMQIINEAGNPFSPAKDIQGLRLNIGDVLRYNRQNGKVYWAINDLDMVSSLVVYALDARYAYADTDFTLPEGPGAKGGGWGLTLRRFNIYPDSAKTTVSPNEEFTVDHSLSDLYSTTFPRTTSGVVLVDDDNNILEILGTLDIPPISDSNRAVGKKIKCKVPDTVAPDKYKLRIAVKTEGKTEWRIVTQIDGNLPTFIDFTVL